MKMLLKFFFRISFIIYILIMVYYLFFKSRAGYWSGQSLYEYVRSSSNIIPFKTIGLYLRSIMEGNKHMNAEIPIRNLVGNIVLFIPFGIYFPSMIKKLIRIHTFTLAMLAILFSIEAIQILTRRGSFDIDDIILNIIGALIGFVFWKSMKRS